MQKVARARNNCIDANHMHTILIKNENKKVAGTLIVSP